jgi:hypothetical protein
VLDAISGYDAADEADAARRGRLSATWWPAAQQTFGAGASACAPHDRVGKPRTGRRRGGRGGSGSAGGAGHARRRGRAAVPRCDRRGRSSPTLSSECRHGHPTIWPDRQEEFGPDLQMLLALPPSRATPPSRPYGPWPVTPKRCARCSPRSTCWPHPRSGRRAAGGRRVGSARRRGRPSHLGAGRQYVPVQPLSPAGRVRPMR